MSTKQLTMPLTVRLVGTCSAAWAEIGRLMVDPATQTQRFYPLGQTEVTHIERRTPGGQRLNGPMGDITERPERFELAAEGNEMLAFARLWATSPVLLAALRELQANPNDPRAHRLALDAIAQATGGAS